MRKKLLIGLALLTSAIILFWVNRTSLLTHVILNRVAATHYEVAANRPIVWEQGPSVAALAVSERPPNIVFILFDDLGINDISTFGGGVAGELVPTPNIDKLAADGAIFSQAYSGTGTCAPSRAMLMTGRYPTRTGFEFTPMPAGMGRVVSTIANSQNDGALPRMDYNRKADEASIPYEDKGLAGSELTIAELLQAKGYHTVHIGKWHLGRNEESRPTAQGFDESLLMDNTLYLPEDSENVVNAKLNFDAIDKFLWAKAQYSASFNNSEPFEPGGYLTDWWTEESLNVIDANKNRPFFLYLAHWAPHTPLQALKEDYDAVGEVGPHRLRVYAAMIRSLDRSVGRVMDKLEQEGLSENTIIIVSSDNGGAGYLGLPEINAPFRGWKITLFEGGIRVPLFLKWPSKIAQGTTVDIPVAHIDILPTLASAASVNLPQDRVIDGQNLLPLATGKGEISRPDDAIYWQSGYYRVVRAGDWKLQYDGRQDKYWLFNLATDPTEQDNLADQLPEKISSLKALLDDHHATAVDYVYPVTVERPVLIDKAENQPASAKDEFIWWPN